MIKLINVSKYYHSNNIVALGLRKVNLTLKSNEFVTIVGESGSGKTTLLNVICGMDHYDEGEMYINDEETSYFGVAELENYRKQYVAFIFQNYNLIESYTVLQNVEAPLILAGYKRKEARKRALEIIDRVGLLSHTRHKATRLSGGQKQRVVIARALAKDCPIIAADEPTGNLDSESSKEILELLHEISHEKLVILVTHDYERVKQYATRKIRIFDGEIVEDVEVKDVRKQNLPKIESEEKKISFWDQVGIAFRNLFAVPKKTILMIFVFSFFSFFVALAYGGFLSIVSYRSSWNMYFNNTSVSRVIVRKSDMSPFTPDELTQLKGLNQVKTVFPHDYFLDARLMMQSSSPGDDHSFYIDIMFLPIEVVSEQQLIAGRLPATDTEVVYALNQFDVNTAEAYVGKTYTFAEWYGFNVPNIQQFTIVGVVESKTINMMPASSFLLITDGVIDVYRWMIYSNYLTGFSLTPDDIEKENIDLLSLMYEFSLRIDNTLPNDVLWLPTTNRIPICEGDEIICRASGTIKIADFYREDTYDDITLEMRVGFANGFIRMNQTTLNKIFYSPDVYQVSVIANTDVNVASTLIRSINGIREGLNLKYKTLYPYQSMSDSLEDTYVDTFGMIANTVVFLVTMIFSVFITYVIFKSIINSKMASYAIFRTIGANKRLIMRLIYFENYIAAFFSYLFLLGVIIFLRSDAGPMYFVKETLKYYNILHYIILLGLLLIMAFLVSYRYCRRVFQQSVHSSLKIQ